MSEPVRVGADERDRVFATLVLAFAADPVERWLYPDAQQYLTCFPEFLEAFGSKAFDEHTVWALNDLSAVALWMPPGVDPDGEASLKSSARPSRPTSTPTRSRCWSRWIPLIPNTRTGICRGSALT